MDNNDFTANDKKIVSEYISHITKADEILEKSVVRIGNGAHINIPLKHIGKRVKIIIWSGHHPCKECGTPIYDESKSLCNDCESKRLRKARDYCDILLKRLCVKK